MARTAVNAKPATSIPPIGTRPPTREFHSTDIKIEQKPDITDDPKDREGDIVKAEPGKHTKAYLDELAFNEEPVTIRLNPSTDKNASTRFPVWVNGKPGEIFQRGRWEEIGYFQTGVSFITKRKYEAVIIGAKIDNLNTEVLDKDEENPRNLIKRSTSPLHSYSVVEDKNPRGQAWREELLRRNM